MILLFILVKRDINVREKEELAQSESEEALRKRDERFDLAWLC
jgi:hypothetical protein